MQYHKNPQEFYQYILTRNTLLHSSSTGTVVEFVLIHRFICTLRYTTSSSAVMHYIHILGIHISALPVCHSSCMHSNTGICFFIMYRPVYHYTYDKEKTEQRLNYDKIQVSNTTSVLYHVIPSFSWSYMSPPLIKILEVLLGVYLIPALCSCGLFCMY